MSTTITPPEVANRQTVGSSSGTATAYTRMPPRTSASAEAVAPAEFFGEITAGEEDAKGVESRADKLVL